MMSEYLSIITDQGKDLEAAGKESGTQIELQKFVVGDGSGKQVTPDPARTALVNEVYRGDISSLKVSPDQSSQYIAMLVLPPDVGGFVVREVGLLTSDGVLYSVGNCPAIEKPNDGVSVNLQYRLAISETAEVTLQIATGDGLFLRQDANLSDVNDASEARDNLGLGTAAVSDSQISTTDSTANRLMRVGAGGLLSTAPKVTASSSNDLSKLPIVSKGGFTEYVTSDGTVYIAGVGVMTSTAGYHSEWLCPVNGTNGSKVAVRNKDTVFNIYNDKNKPSAGDVGALPTAGGNMAGQITVSGVGHGSFASQNSVGAPLYQLINSASASEYWPIIKQKYQQANSTWSMGVLINSDRLQIHYVSAADPNGKSFGFNKDGTFTPGSWTNFDARYQAKGSYTPAGQAYTKAESDARYQGKGSYYTTAQSDSRYVQDVRLGSQGTMTSAINGNSISPAGCVLTGYFTDGSANVNKSYYRPVQRNKNGTWATVAQI
jgi:hypothetical protein